MLQVWDWELYMNMTHIILSSNTRRNMESPTWELYWPCNISALFVWTCLYWPQSIEDLTQIGPWELDLHIHYHLGKKNANANALSHSPIASPSLPKSSSPAVVLLLGEQQFKDRVPWSSTALRYPETGVFLAVTKWARELALSIQWWSIYRVEITSDRKQIFEEAHAQWSPH